MATDLHQLRAFVAVVDEGTFTDAAITLQLSQAAVSRAVAGFESSIGARLLHRGPREATLTTAGSRVLVHARRVLDEVARLEESLSRPAGEFRIGYHFAVLGAHTVAVQRDWSARHPGNPLVFVQSTSASAGLHEGLVEAAVLRRVPSVRRIATELIGTENRYAAIAATDPLARRRRLTLKDLEDRIIAVDPLVGTTSGDLFAGRPVEVRTTHNIDEWMTAIAASQAIGMTPESTVHQYRRPGMVYRRVVDVEPVSVWLAWQRDAPPDRIDDLLAMMRKAYAS
ncbi:MAG: LysR family transcriptional regulator [Gordonia sp.]|nr:LysR family transcriptional regulator [Gordonia sp. (in: high G+C Gram-positive bacteria)]